MTWPTFSHKGKETQVDKQLVARESYGKQIQVQDSQTMKIEEESEEKRMLSENEHPSDRVLVRGNMPWTKIQARRGERAATLNTDGN